MSHSKDDEQREQYRVVREQLFLIREDAIVEGNKSIVKRVDYILEYVM